MLQRLIAISIMVVCLAGSCTQVNAQECEKTSEVSKNANVNQNGENNIVINPPSSSDNDSNSLALWVILGCIAGAGRMKDSKSKSNSAKNTSKEP